MTDDPRPWDRLDGEGPRAWEGFATYRGLGPGRSIDAAYQQRTSRTGRAAGHWNAWARDFRWVERARAWDAHQDAAATRATIDATTRAATLAGAILTRALDRLSSILDDLTPGELIRALATLDRVIENATRRAAPPTALDDAALLAHVIATYGGRAIAGDHDAAGVVLRALERRAQAEGTDATPSAETSLGWLLGGLDPIRLPPDLRAQLVDHARTQTPRQTDAPTPLRVITGRPSGTIPTGA